MMIRDAVESDIPAITAIYNAVIKSSNSVYRDEPVTESERLQWLQEKYLHNFPVIVIEEAGELLGYAGYGAFRAAAGYRYTVEHTIHISESHRRKGLGRKLLEELLIRAKSDGCHVMIGAIDSGNLPSIKLHEVYGFKECARITEVAMKHGEFLDLVLMEKKL
jgi:phosphinothricin acetyltransferase